MPTYRKRHPVEAHQWLGLSDDEPEVEPLLYHDSTNICYLCGDLLSKHGWLRHTYTGSGLLCPGSWIIKDRNARYTYKADHFIEDYEPIL